MPPPGARPRLARPAALALAAVFAAATCVYSLSWMHYSGARPSARLGVHVEFSYDTGSILVTGIERGSAADHAGLRAGDRILAVDGQPLRTMNPFFDRVQRGRPGDRLTLLVERPGAPKTIPVNARLEPVPSPAAPPAPTELVLSYALRAYPLGFLVVGVVVLFQRPLDRHAWLLALLFGGFIAAAPLREEVAHPALRGFALAYKTAFSAMLPALFYAFFAAFPVPSPVDRRLPWLKTALPAAAGAAGLVLGALVFRAGSFAPLFALQDRLGGALVGYPLAVYSLAAIGLGAASLIANNLRADAAARRKTRVIVWGTLAGLAPMLLLQTAAGFAERSPYAFPLWIWAPAVLALFLIPAAFAYAVVKHRVLEIPVLLKRSARYLLVQRGFTVLILVVSVAATAALAAALSRVLAPRSEIAAPAGLMAGVGFGLLMAWSGVRLQQRVTRHLDRAFFRSAYDARQILEDVAEATHRALDRDALAELLERSVRQALHPSAAAVYLLQTDGTRLRRFAPGAATSTPADTLNGTAPDLIELERLGRPWSGSPAEAVARFDEPALLGAECLSVLPGRAGRTVGLLALGPRLSDEPYSREDLRLLASVSRQAGLALDNIALAEAMAERLELERRTAHEMNIAREVQRKLLPQRAPKAGTLDYAGRCIQARAVGGDYYDFLDLGPGRLGLVLADISGKGISAALLMANLQANLRSRYALALDDLPGLLTSVDRLFFESTAPNHFATLFMATYDDATHGLRYANCGHNPPLVLRRDGSVMWLAPTAGVVGLFDTWSCAVAELELSPGDLFVAYTDGVTEAMNEAGEEFGETRLVEAVRSGAVMPAEAVIDRVISAVQQFSGTMPEDDLTLLVARVRDA